MLDSPKNIFVELVGTQNGDLGVSDHLWPDFFGAELSGGVPGAGEGMKKIEFACNVETWVKKHAKSEGFESRFEIWTSGQVDPAQNRAPNPFRQVPGPKKTLTY